jgi:hypothetical protein
MSYVTHVMNQWYFSYKLSIKSGQGEGQGQGQIRLPRPSATALLSGRRQKYLLGRVVLEERVDHDIALSSGKSRG